MAFHIPVLSLLVLFSICITGCASDDSTPDTGEETSSLTPLAAGPPFSAGFGRTCELVDGRVRVWGANSEAWQVEPRWLDFDASGAIELSCDGAGGCVLDAAGGIQCWDYEEGTLAVGLTSHSEPDATQLNTDDGTQCMLIADDVVCHVRAGAPLQGLGTGRVVLTEVTSPIALTLGPSAGCTVDGAGAVFCFGDQNIAQTGGFNESVPPSRIEGLPPMVDVAVGLLMACAWTAEGAGWCWGQEYGEVENLPPHEVLASGVANMAVASIGNYRGHAWCALDREGSVVCDGPGEMEYPDTSGMRFSEIRSGKDHICGRGEQGALWCWGWDVEAERDILDRQWSGTPVQLEASRR